MQFEDTGLPGAKIVRLTPFRDERGSFVRTWCRDSFASHGIPIEIVQGNCSVTRARGSLRGMHFQRPPCAESKIVRVTRGRIHDVIVDLRQESPACGRFQALELGGDDTMLYVPPGLAHGFQTLTDDVMVEYLMGDQPYSPDHQDGFRFDDPQIGIPWPLPVTAVSGKDLAWPPLGGRVPLPSGGAKDEREWRPS